MSYSICNVLAEAGLDNVLKWVPFDIDRQELTNRIGNKMIRPTTVPQSLEELLSNKLLQEKHFVYHLNNIKNLQLD